jgi:mono/diheme cytochrome c family protein
MKAKAIAAVLLIWLAACASAPEALDEADLAARMEIESIERGRAYAMARCASCHAIREGEAPSPNLAAPPFQVIADTPGMTRTALNAWLHNPHPSMPILIVEQDRIDDLSAFLGSMREAE